MKRLCLTVWLCLAGVTLFAQADLSTAEELYRQGKFSAALSQYEELLKNYPNDPFVYYNIGNCYFKMGSRGLATANYYRAFRLAPRDKDIRHNLALALEQSGERLVPNGMPVILHQAFFALSYDELKGLAYVLFWVVCVLSAVCLWRRKWNGLATLSCVLCVLCAGWLYARRQAQAPMLAVIAAPVAEVRSGPGSNFPASANVAQGHLVTILDSKDTWDEVVVSSQGLKGWIEQSAVEKI